MDHLAKNKTDYFQCPLSENPKSDLERKCPKEDGKATGGSGTDGKTPH